MSSIISLGHQIVQLPDTVGMLWVYKMSQRNWGGYKGALQVSPKVSVGLARIETGICPFV